MITLSSYTLVSCTFAFPVRPCFAGSTWCAGMTAGDDVMENSTNQYHDASQLFEQRSNGLHSPATEQSTDMAVTQKPDNITRSSDEQHQEEQGSNQRPSTPYAAVRKDRAWKVARDASGGMAGLPRPAVSGRVQHILDKIFKVSHLHAFMLLHPAWQGFTVSVSRVLLYTIASQTISQVLVCVVRRRIHIGQVETSSNTYPIPGSCERGKYCDGWSYAPRTPEGSQRV